MTDKTPAQRAEGALIVAHGSCPAKYCDGTGRHHIAIERAVLAARLEQAQKALDRSDACRQQTLTTANIVFMLADERDRLRRELDAMDKEGA